MDQPLDLFVLGAGSGGVRAARLAAQSGARVVVSDGAPLGGTCVNLGCIPKKLYSYAAHYADDFADAAGYGWEVGQPVFHWDTLKRRRRAELARLNGVYEQLLLNAGVHIERGWARLRDAHTVEVHSAQGVRVFTAKNILLATGGEPVIPVFPGSEHAVSSDAMFDLDPFPRSLVVVGGGYIACEFASIFEGLGASVTQLYRGEQILRGFDDDVRARVATEMRAHGVD
ncbi:MAG: glutathione-disulfide reductase, partial [Comamonadaceae bacterium]